MLLPKVHLCTCIWALGRGHFDVVKETFSLKNRSALIAAGTM